MMLSSYLAAASIGLSPGNTQAQDFAGWQGMRVIEQKGTPYRMQAADLDGDGDEELVIVNIRNARLDVYGWKDKDSAADDNTSTPTDDLGKANDLPMAPELDLVEIPVRQPPIDVAVLAAPDGSDQHASLLVLVSDPNQLVEIAWDTEESSWKTARRWDLLSGRVSGVGDLLQLIPHSTYGSTTVLVSFEEGIQTLTLQADPDEPVTQDTQWLEPRESGGRMNWWLGDLDEDGHLDLVEWTSQSNQSIRWYPGSDQGFRPASVLHDRGVSMVSLLARPDTADELLVLESSPQGVVRRYRIGQGDTADFGKQEPLVLPGGEKAVWASMALEGQPTLVVADPNQPRVTLYAHTPSGWLPGDSYPVSGKIKALYELPGQPGTLVLWPEDSNDLYASHWTGGRLTFPQPVALPDDGGEYSILGLGTTPDAVWCVQKAGKDLFFHRIQTVGQDLNDDSRLPVEQLEVVAFADKAGKAEQVIALDHQRLLVADKFTKGLRLVNSIDGASGEAQDTSPSRLSKASLEDFRVFYPAADAEDPSPRIAWQTDGVVQWLGDQMFAQDQIMLPHGKRIADLLLLDDGSALALEQGGGAIHRLEPDDGGVLRVASTTRLETYGRSLTLDKHLGLLLTTSSGVTRLTEGQPQELEVVQSLDSRAGRPEGVSDATVHRVTTMDIDGDGRDDALFTDDIRHQLTALGLSGEGQLEPMLSWPVFEDIAYPYGGGGDEVVREPRGVISLDLDGDGGQDFAMLCHDRLLIYLANDTLPEDQP
ncbi:hypothetical protein [Algisphaera agarilytica]|uniref:hypothetical protein n=1 Tax=Algisphaera agarilytica TaxID=1385975 RepID=UPI001C872B7F|nr:hypothetical protein [Algisphaera agarilytica]